MFLYVPLNSKALLQTMFSRRIQCHFAFVPVNTSISLILEFISMAHSELVMYILGTEIIVLKKDGKSHILCYVGTSFFLKNKNKESLLKIKKV